MNETSGAIYFADDDNTYDWRFLDKMRWVKRVAVFNVGLIDGHHYEGPIQSNGTVIGWRTPWLDRRTFPTDMAGFVVNLQFFSSRKPRIKQLLFRSRRKVNSEFTKNLKRM